MNDDTTTKAPPIERKTVSISIENRDALERLRCDLPLTPKLQALTDRVVQLGIIELRKQLIP